MSKIEWTNQTWNPIIGCSKVSAGCQNCYAETMANRLVFMPATKYIYPRVVKMENYAFGYGYEDSGQWVAEGWNGKTSFVNSALDKPLKRKKPTMYFVCSMGDLFHESVPFEWIEKIYEVINNCPQHTFQILTKRPERMLKFYEYLGNKIREHGFDSIPSQSKKLLDYVGIMPNIWLGVTAETQENANKRLPILVKIPAKVKFVSVEPMLGAIDISLWMISGYMEPPYNDIINWVICGGESGSNARPMHPDWVRSLRDQCKQANVPFFFKQWGEWMQVGECGNTKNDKKYYHAKNCQILNLNGGMGFHGEKSIYVQKTGKKNAGSLLDGKEYKEFPEL